MMNRIAYRTTGLAIKAISKLSKARINIHGKEKIPEGSNIFVINHFTRMETLLLPCLIFELTDVPVWSLADYNFFKGSLGTFLDKVGAVSTKSPDRDLLIVKTLLTGEADWIIFPEGHMVKDKKIFEKGHYMLSYAGGKRPPHTGAATLALRTEFYRRRLKEMSQKAPDEARRILDLFQIRAIEPVLERATQIVPVNLTYYPIRARENILSSLASHFVEDIPERMKEEIMTEGSMLLSGVDIDIRFGDPIRIKEYMTDSAIDQDISTKRKIDFDDPIPSRPRMRKVAFDLMLRYMTAIYSMTTVNPDHLFASILKLIPSKKIDIPDLRRRVFLTSTLNLAERGIYFHESLSADQVHLLTDDRYRRFKNFLSVALEKGVVQKKGDTLIKDLRRLSLPFDFHRVRIDNPIAVIANEVEPLTALQRGVRGLSWKPGYWLRRKIAAHLLERAVQEFEKDYAEFFVEGESKGLDVGRPYLVGGGSREIGVVLIHGYMAAPLELKALADYLGRRGFWVYVPRLKGHGTSPEDLARRTYMNWVESADTGYAIVQNICRRIVVGGFSTGAGLALDLAARVPDVAGVFAVCPPMKLHDLSARLVPAVDVWNRLMKKVHFEGARVEFVENRPENPHINYSRNPISGIRELERLMESIEPKLPDLKAPALVIQSHGDPVVDPRGSRRIFEKLGSVDKQYLVFNFDRHGILLGDGAHQVHSAIGDFVDRSGKGSV